MLPFTPMEELMFHQDCSAYPCTCFVRMRFVGRLGKDALEPAVQRAIARHPMLAARVDPNQSKLRWQLDPEPTQSITWQEADISDEFPTASSLQLDQGGLRLQVRLYRDLSDLLLHFHHAAVDGLGISQFIHDFMLFYSEQKGVSHRKRALRQYETSRLKQRGTMGLTWGKLVSMIPKQAIGLAGVRQFLMRKPVPLVPHKRASADAATAHPFPTAQIKHFSAEESKLFRFTAKQAGVTTNDLLCRDLFLAMNDFRQEEGITDDDAWLRLMVPFSLRGAADRHLPAANVVSSVFLDRKGSQMSDPADLLVSIHDEMQLIKENELGYTFVLSLCVNRMLPGGLRRVARGNRCNASAVFTNLGRLVSRTGLPSENGEAICGDVRLQHLEILPPLAPFTCIAFGAGWYANRLSISMRYDLRVLTTDQASALLDKLVTRIRETKSEAEA